MLSMSEQRSLFAELEPKLQGADAEWLLLYYRCKLEPSQGKLLAEAYAQSDAADDPDASSSEAAAAAAGGGSDGAGGRASVGSVGGADGGGGGTSLVHLKDNCDMLTAAAEYEYGHDHFRECYRLSCRVLAKDPFQKHVLPVHVCSMMRLDYHSELFYLAHQLVEEYPAAAVSWYAVGCYYHMVGDFENARRYFSKSTTIDHRFAPAWVGFGHAFAAQDESDQAMAAYRTASRLFPGSHIPWLGIGMEYLRTNHLHLALQYIRQAQEICPTEPLVLHELGVLHYLNGEYDDAVGFFLRVAENCRDYDDAVREPSIFNLGHAYRKQRELDKAEHWYREALAINPRVASTYSALGFTLHLKGELDHAISYYHQSLSLKPDDTFTCEMLSEALQDALNLGDDFGMPGGSMPLPEPGRESGVSSIGGRDSDMMME